MTLRIQFILLFNVDGSKTMPIFYRALGNCVFQKKPIKNKQFHSVNGKQPGDSTRATESRQKSDGSGVVEFKTALLLGCCQRVKFLGRYDGILLRLNVMRECKACLAMASRGKAGLALRVARQALHSVWQGRPCTPCGKAGLALRVARQALHSGCKFNDCRFFCITFSRTHGIHHRSLLKY